MLSFEVPDGKKVCKNCKGIADFDYLCTLILNGEGIWFSFSINNEPYSGHNSRYIGASVRLVREVKYAPNSWGQLP